MSSMAFVLKILNSITSAYGFLESHENYEYLTLDVANQDHSFSRIKQ